MFIYLFIMCISAAAYAPMRTLETYRQTKPRGKVKKKGGKRPKPLPPEVILIMQTGHPYSTLFMVVLWMVRMDMKPIS